LEESLRQGLSDITIARIEQPLLGAIAAALSLGFRNIQKMAIGPVAWNAPRRRRALWKFKAMSARDPLHGIDVLTIRKLDPG
jgi:hypothetical protein